VAFFAEVSTSRIVSSYKLIVTFNLFIYLPEIGPLLDYYCNIANWHTKKKFSAFKLILRKTCQLI
jgi:hypothetical protein